MNDEYVKDFDKWNELKKTINSKDLPIEFFFLEREIWWASLGVNIGSEIDGRNDNYERPVLILKKFSDDILWVLPISNTIKSGEYFHTMIHKGRLRTILLLQLRLVSVNRLLRLVSRIGEEEFQVIVNKVVDLLRASETPVAGGISMDITET